MANFTFVCRHFEDDRQVTVKVTREKNTEYEYNVELTNFMLRDHEWDVLKAMLRHGTTFFQDGEATIDVTEVVSVKAFLKGGE